MLGSLVSDAGGATAKTPLACRFVVERVAPGTNPDPGAQASSDEEEVQLQDTSHRRVVRIGNTVHRPTYPWSAAIHALLKHLEDVDFPYSPRILGFDKQGREVLSYIEGDAGPKGWARVVDERGLRNAARLLRDYHQAVAEWQPSQELTWSNGKQGAGDPGDTICHGDFGPWNIVWDGIRPAGLIDWDYAYPGPARGDLVYALEYVVPFRDDQECLRHLGYQTPPDRRRRLETFSRAYGAKQREFDALADQVITGQRAMLDQVKDLASRGIQPQALWVEQGYADEIERRIRWTEENQHLFH